MTDPDPEDRPWPVLDQEAWRQILNGPAPAEPKLLGRQTEGFYDCSDDKPCGRPGCPSTGGENDPRLIEVNVLDCCLHTMFKIP
jgi:hypothetical protein